ncbi:hypothetical protein SHIRM173S_09312 [Streptomyces hirsutus]
MRSATPGSPAQNDISRGGQATNTVDGCPNGGHATSNAFPRTNLTSGHGSGGTANGTAPIYNDARAGSYDITAHCSGRNLTNGRPRITEILGGTAATASAAAAPTGLPRPTWPSAADW